MKLWFRIHGYEPCSWTFVWQNLKETFESLGVEVTTYEQPEHPEEYIELWWGDPQYFRWSNLNVMAKVAIALSEARSIRKDGRERFIYNLNKAEMIFCPSQFAAIGILESPIETPVRITPFGVNKDEFKYIERGWEGTFTFLHAGVLQFRKGSWLVPEAFIKAFDEEDDVSLTLATFFRPGPMFMKMKNEYRNKQIKFFEGMTDSAVELYEKHHVYVSPHLSEGFGLMVPEAMSTGMPCIVSRCSAPREFFDKEYGWWIEMSENYAPLNQCLPDTAGFWRIPDVNSLADAMRSAYENKTEAQVKGACGSEFVQSKLTWKHTARKMILCINELLDSKRYGASGIRKLYGKENEIEKNISYTSSI